jgi:hypothetical protein
MQRAAIHVTTAGAAREVDGHPNGTSDTDSGDPATSDAMTPWT